MKCKEYENIFFIFFINKQINVSLHIVLLPRSKKKSGVFSYFAHFKIFVSMTQESIVRRSYYVL